MLTIASKPFVRNFNKSVKRVNERLKKYLNDPNEDNIHDIRTSIRRLNAAFGLLPKKIRKRPETRNYITQSRALFKVNTEIRDYDIIYGKLTKYSSHPAYKGLTRLLTKRRNAKLEIGHKMALALRNSTSPQISANDISELKLQIRFNKILNKLRNRIEQALPVVLIDSNKIEELHGLRKDYKKLRYLLELLSRRGKKISKQINYLQSLQDILGSIRDSDIVIDYLRNVRSSIGVDDILPSIIAERNQKYEEFVQFFEESTQESNRISLLN
jgi:CHAD domain-containing protein